MNQAEGIVPRVDRFRSVPECIDNEIPRATDLHDVVFVRDLSTTARDRQGTDNNSVHHRNEICHVGSGGLSSPVSSFP
jgi:hypothetical protein